MEKGRGDEGKDEQHKRKEKMFENQIGNAKTPHPHYKCPRCDSNHTKFCYYNNYNITQPRYFCKSCRRYWTQGGCQRNIPIGGGIRKVRRANDSSSNSNGEAGSSSNFSTTPQPLVRNLYGMVGALSRRFCMLPGNQEMRESTSTVIPLINSHYSCNGSMPYNLATHVHNLNSTLPGANGFGKIFVPCDFNRSVTVRPQQARVLPIQDRVPPIEFTTNQIRLPNSNTPNIINHGKEPMFPADSFHQRNSFQDLNKSGKELTYSPNRSLYQTKHLVDSWNQGCSSNIDNNNNVKFKSSPINNNYINNVNPIPSSSFTFWNSYSGNNNNNIDNNNNNNVDEANLDPNECPNNLPDFDPPKP